MSRFDVVPCADAHDNEVFDVFEVTGDRYPGRENLTDIAEARCAGSAFTDYVGVPLEESDLDVFQILPTKDTWTNDDDREIICALYGKAGRQIIGSARSTPHPA